MFAPAECLEQLKCSLCKRLLSRFPIYVTEDKDDQLLSICGRCKVPSDNKKYFRNKIYENGMKNVQFPCINKQNGCMEHLLPEIIKQHELLCQYQIIKCQICEWEGQLFTGLNHYRTKHVDLILKNYKFKMNIEEDLENSNILLHKETIFSFEYNFDQNLKRIKCTLTPLFSTKSVKKYYSQINLMIDNIIMLNRFPEIDIDENEPKSIDINIGNILTNDSTEAMGIINISNNKNDSSIQEQNEESLSKSMCSIDTDALNLTCQYECGYTTINESDLKQHYNSCLNKPYNCLFSCMVNNQLCCKGKIARKDLRTHIVDKHPADVTGLNDSSTIEMGILVRRQRYCKFLTDRRGNDFILIVQYIKYHSLLWRVEVLNSIQNINNYRFEIRFRHNNKPKSFATFCAELTCKEYYKTNYTPCIMFSQNKIESFVRQPSLLSFNITVYNGSLTIIS